MFAEDSQPLDDYDELHDLSIHHVGRWVFLGAFSVTATATVDLATLGVCAEAQRQPKMLPTSRHPAKLVGAPLTPCLGLDRPDPPGR